MTLLQKNPTYVISGDPTWAPNVTKPWRDDVDGIVSDITLVSEKAFAVPAGANHDEALPAGAQEGDLVVVSTCMDTGQPWIVSGQGYRDVYGGIMTAQTSPPKHICVKFMGATPDTQVTINGESIPSAGAIQIWRGVDTNNFLDGTLTEANSTTGMPNSPSYTTINGKVLRLIYGFLDDDDVAAGVGAPSGYTNLLASDTGQASTTQGATQMVASKIETTAATADDPAAFSGTGNDVWRAVHFGLKPKEVPGPWPSAAPNLFTFPEAFDNAAWTKVRSVITADTTLAPDGNTTADTLTASAAAGGTRVAVQHALTTAGGNICIAIHTKYVDNPWLYVQMQGVPGLGGNQTGWFNIQTGVKGTSSGGAIDAYDIVAAANGFYRCYIKMNTLGDTGMTPRFALTTGDGLQAAIADGLSCALWGASATESAALQDYSAT